MISTFTSLPLLHKLVIHLRFWVLVIWRCFIRSHIHGCIQGFLRCGKFTTPSTLECSKSTLSTQNLIEREKVQLCHITTNTVPSLLLPLSPMASLTDIRSTLVTHWQRKGHVRILVHVLPSPTLQIKWTPIPVVHLAIPSQRCCYHHCCPGLWIPPESHGLLVFSSRPALNSPGLRWFRGSQHACCYT